MKKIIKLVSVLLLSAMFFMNVGIYAFDTEMNKGTNVKSYDLLAGLGILDGSAKPSDYLTRGYLASVAVTLTTGAAEVPELNEKVKFTDVSYTDENYSGIYYAASLGFMNGVSDSLFEPSSVVDYEQLVTVLLRVLGYEGIANEKGGFPAGYMNIAAANGLLKNVNIKNSAEITVKDLSDMAYNALSIGLAEYNESARSYKVSDRTILKNVMKLTTVDGILTTPRVHAAYGDYVYVGDKLLETDGTNYENINGYKVRAYVSLDDNSVAYIDTKKGENDIFEIASEDIISVGSNYVEFYNESGKKTSIDFDSTVTVIKNDRLTEFNIEDFRIENGSLKFIGSGTYHSVIIHSASTIMAGSVIDKKIYDYYNSDVYIDLNGIKYSVNYEGNEISIDDIKRTDVISAAYSKGRDYCRITVYRRSYSGSISELTDDTIVVGRTELYATRYFWVNNPKISAGDIVTIYADDNRNAVGAVLKDKAEYGYLMDAADSSGISGEVLVKLLTEDSKMEVFKLARAVKVNGGLYIKEPTMHSGILRDTLCTMLKANGDGTYTKRIMNDVVRQIVKYELNEKGEIRSIYTASEPSSDNSEKALELYDEQTDIRYKTGARQFWKSYILSADDSVVFTVPRNDNNFDEYGNLDSAERNGNDEKFYRCDTGSKLENDKKYDIKVYDVTDGGTMSRAVVVESNASGLNPFSDTGSDIMIIDRVFKTVNVDGDETYGISGYCRKNPVKVVVAQPEYFNFTKNGITIVPEAGDIIQYSVNAFGELDSFEMRYDESGDIDLLFNSDQLFALYGSYAYNKDKYGFAVVDDVTNPVNQKIFSFNGMQNYYIYNKKNNQIRLGTAEDIIAYKNAREDFSRIIVRTTYCVAREAVIYED